MTDFAREAAIELYDRGYIVKRLAVPSNLECVEEILRRLLAKHASPDLDTLARELAAEIIGPAWTPEDASHIAVMMNEALAPYFAARDEREAASIDGVVVFMRSEREDGDRCICCDGPHIFNRRLVLDPWESRLPKHMQTSVNDWLYDAVLFDNANEGARVRVTVEILALLPKEASDED